MSLTSAELEYARTRLAQHEEYLSALHLAGTIEARSS
jgi:hypothetical protein